MRRTCVGSTGAVRASKSRVTGTGLSIQATRGLSAVPPTTPNATLPGISGCALGHMMGRGLRALTGGLLLRLFGFEDQADNAERQDARLGRAGGSPTEMTAWRLRVHAAFLGQEAS